MKTTASFWRVHVKQAKMHMHRILLFMSGRQCDWMIAQFTSGATRKNVAYPSGLCAERVALFHVGAMYPAVPVNTIAVTCSSLKFVVDKPLSPCGSCRQVIAETERRYGKPIRILLAGEKGAVYAVAGIKELLPLSFEAEQLKAK